MHGVKFKQKEMALHDTSKVMFRVKETGSHSSRKLRGNVES